MSTLLEIGSDSERGSILINLVQFGIECARLGIDSIKNVPFDEDNIEEFAIQMEEAWRARDKEQYAHSNLAPPPFPSWARDWVTALLVAKRLE